jgi:hypothetical protein
MYDVNTRGLTEAVGWSLYDTNTYAAAGQLQMQFFQVPRGQGAVPKTLADTNMTLAGQLPKPQNFLAYWIELYIIPSAALSAVGALTAAAFANDVMKFYTQPASLTFRIGDKNYVEEAPLIKFPPRGGLTGFSAASDTTTAAAAGRFILDYATNSGPLYEIDPALRLVDSQNFSVVLDWPALVTLSADAKIVCNLGGYLYRSVQ